MIPQWFDDAKFGMTALTEVEPVLTDAVRRLRRVTDDVAGSAVVADPARADVVV